MKTLFAVALLLAIAVTSSGCSTTGSQNDEQAASDRQERQQDNLMARHGM